ncbi:hypothetical protein [Gordonia terrae]|uniref:hypothetical protein n=1 Tax=Gordonia terrae TaxID=2055 RepID=UPI003F6C1422
MNRFPLAFFSFVHLADNTPENHRNYNRWHLMDHRPENLALPGVAWGERWSHKPDIDCMDGATAAFGSVDYVAMYWFNDPVEESVAEWNRLGADSFEWGRGPLIPGVQRPLLGFFRPVKGYAAASALVSAEVLPLRPNRGVHLTLTRFDDARGAPAHEHHAAEDRELIPELLDLAGVAGAWTFTFSHHQNVTMRPRTNSDDPEGSMRIRLVYIDGDLSSTTERICQSHNDFNASRGFDRGDSCVQTLACMSLGSIVPFADW